MKPKIFGPLLFQIKELQIQIQICLGVNETSRKQPKSPKTSIQISIKITCKDPQTPKMAQRTHVLFLAGLIHT